MKTRVDMKKNLPPINSSIQIACRGDARNIPIAAKSVDVIVTSPPYWSKRDYGGENQIGTESTADEFVRTFEKVLSEFRRVLADHGSVFFNMGDTYSKRSNSMLNLPFQVANIAMSTGWIQRNLIVWNKSYSTPSSSRRRLTNRHEFIFHFVKSNKYYYDLQGYKDRFGLDDSTADVWNLQMTKSKTKHLAPFPQELVERVLYLACPKAVCTKCGKPITRVAKPTNQLNPNRKQAIRAMELAIEHGLSQDHIKAIRSVGISDSGKAVQVQTGAGKNRETVIALANEAKQILKGYYREFTFPLWETMGWKICSCNSEFRSGVVLDPFMGTGTTLRAANLMDLSAIGIDIDTTHFYINN